MKVDGSKPVTPAKRSGQAKPVKHAGKAGSTDGASAPRRIEDVAAVHGIPEAELTPKVRDAIMSLMAEVDSLRQELGSAQKVIAELQDLADQDPLLPVLNRRAFVRELTRTLDYNSRYSSTASLIYFDLDNFKQVNDSHGHAAGDSVLGHVAAILKAHTRISDVIGRLGGDEFAVILPKANRQMAARKSAFLAHKIESTPLTFDGRTIAVSVSYGAELLAGGVEATEALAGADHAMYRQKRAQTDGGAD